MVFESKKPLTGAILASRCRIAYGQAGEDGASPAGEVALARAWGAPPALARALRVHGLVAGGADGIELLEQVVAAVDGAEHGLEATRCLLDLGVALRRAGRLRSPASPSRPYVRLGSWPAFAAGDPVRESTTAIAAKLHGS